MLKIEHYLQLWLVFHIKWNEITKSNQFYYYSYFRVRFEIIFLWFNIHRVIFTFFNFDFLLSKNYKIILKYKIWCMKVVKLVIWGCCYMLSLPYHEFYKATSEKGRKVVAKHVNCVNKLIYQDQDLQPLFSFLDLSLFDPL